LDHVDAEEDVLDSAVHCSTSWVMRFLRYLHSWEEVFICSVFLDWELISYLSPCWGGLRLSCFKMKFGMIVLHVHTHWLTEEDFWYDVITFKTAAMKSFPTEKWSYGVCTHSICPTYMHSVCPAPTYMQHCLPVPDPFRFVFVLNKQ